MHVRERPITNGRLTKWVVGIASCGLILLPAFAYTFGKRGAPMENRRPAEFSGLEHGWHSFTDLGQYINDRLPLRARAVATDAWVDQRVFHEDPAFGGGSSPRVIRGEDGMLFLTDAIDVACQPNAALETVVTNLDRLATIIADSGRNLVTMVAPDKSTVHPELLPTDLDKRPCFDAATEAMWTAFNEAQIPGFVDLRAALIDRSNTTRELLYLRKDSHWDSAGSLVAVEAAVEAFSPGLWRDSEVAFGGLTSYGGDLTSLLGGTNEDQAPSYYIVRPDITQVANDAIDDIEGGSNRHIVNSGADGRLIKGKTLMFFDSYGMAAQSQFEPFFEDLTVVRLVDFDADRFAAMIAEADNVWFMSVERSLGWRMSYQWSTEFLDQLEATLK